MKLLYIDANIYLRFYDSNNSSFKKLLTSISELTTKIFFTSQFGDEIDRNKLNVFKQSVTTYIKQSALSQISLPEHLDDQDFPKLSAWNKKRQELEKPISELNKELNVILNDIMASISMSQDNVSKVLEGLYRNNYIYSETDLIRARHRKEIGNPPGKREDPLGDQFSWELLLNIIPKVEKLWIVSNDMDYFSENQSSYHLNPVLYKDLIGKNKNVQIKVFNSLTEALRDFNKEETINSIPPEDELNKISKSEEISSGTPRIFLSYGYDSLNPAKPIKCPNCGTDNSFLDGTFLKSTLGRISFQFVCSSCGYHFDTGNFFK